MTRRLIAGLLVVGLAIGVWALWPREEPDPSPTTTVNAVDSTTTTSVADPVTTTTLESHVVTTVEEAEVILRELWFGWFEGIYNQDEDRIRDVVGSPTALDNALAQFGVMEFALPRLTSGQSISRSRAFFDPMRHAWSCWAQRIRLSGSKVASSRSVFTSSVCRRTVAVRFVVDTSETIFGTQIASRNWSRCR